VQWLSRNSIDVSDEVTFVANLIDCAALAAGNRMAAANMRDAIQSVLDTANSRLRKLARELVAARTLRANADPAQG
jgi:hypothetical protein